MFGGAKFMVIAGKTNWTRLLNWGNYLAVFLVGVPLGILANDVYPGIPVFKGQAWVVLAPWVCAFVSGALWLRFRSDTKRSPILTAFLLSFAAMWLALWLLEHADGRSQNYTTFLVPVLVSMLISKPVSLRDVQAAAAALAWSTMGIVIVAEIHAAFTGEGSAVGGLALRIPGLNQIVTSGSRWEGPFGSPNYAGPVACYLLVYALTQRGFRLGVLGIFAVLMLLLSGSRSAFLGVAVALAVYLVFTSSPLLARFGKSIRILLITLAAAPMVAIALSQDPTLNGRTPIWPHYWEFWLSSPITGVGTSNINQLLQNGTLHLSNVHAHDLGLDLLGRYGLVGFVMALLTLALAAVITWRGAKSGAPFGLAIVLAFLAIGLVEVHGSWMYWSVPSAWLLLAVLWGWNVAVSSGRSTVTH